MNRMGIPQPGYTPDGVLAEIARVVPFFKGAVWEKLGDNGKQWSIQEGCIGTEILHTDTFKRGLGEFRGWSLVPRSTPVAQTFVQLPLTMHKVACIVSP